MEDPEARELDAVTLEKARFMLSNIASTTISAFAFVMPALFASSLTISTLIKIPWLAERRHSRLQQTNGHEAGCACPLD